MSNEIEARPYGPESGPEVRRLIQDRLTLYSDNVIMYREVPVQTVFVLDLVWEKIHQITDDLEYFYMIIDLTEAKPPSAEIRNHLSKLFATLDKLLHVAVFTERNFMLNIAAKFVFTGLRVRSFTIHKTLKEALEDIHAKA